MKRAVTIPHRASSSRRTQRSSIDGTAGIRRAREPIAEPNFVRAEGLEPSRAFAQWHLKPSCMPIPPRPPALRSYRPDLPKSLSVPGSTLCDNARKGGTVRSTEEFDTVQRLIAEGLSDCAIARQTDVPRRTVCQWRHGPNHRQALASDGQDFAGLPAEAYCYLLGLYLGDGCISRDARTFRLRVTLDAKYPAIVERCRMSIDALMPGQHATTHRRSDNCFEVYLYSRHWPRLFPQHGPGKKHHRPIRLEAWQQALVEQATKEFIRGLIDSYGCRTVANDRGVRSVRYHFSNRSGDIRGLFCAALDRLGIPWTQNSPYQIAVYRKSATARLDEFVGPKA